VCAQIMTLIARRPELDAEPAETLVLERVLAGRTLCEGVFVTSFTGHRTTLQVAIAGSWDGAVLTLDENFVFGDGSTDHKTWRFRKTGEGTYDGTREDVIGVARAVRDGRAVRLDYRIRLSGVAVRFRDLLYLDENGAVVNRAVVSKFGLVAGRLELIMRPQR
jgi:hypothetical protein